MTFFTFALRYTVRWVEVLSITYAHQSNRNVYKRNGTSEGGKFHAINNATYVQNDRFL